MSRQSTFSADPLLITALSEMPSAVVVPCPEDKVLFRQGAECSGVFILQNGCAVLELESDAGDIVAHFEAGDGSLLGLPAVLSGGPYSLTATALRGAEVKLVHRADFLTLMESSSALALNALQIVANQTRAARIALVKALERRERMNAGGNGW